MFTLFVPRYLKGYAKIRVNKENITEFLNYAAKENIAVFDVKEVKDSFSVGCLLSDLEKIKKHLSDDENESVHKFSFLISLKNNKNRIGVLLGAVLAAVFLIFLSTFVFQIEITGNERLSKNVIAQALSECGLCEGCKKRNIIPHKLENEMLEKLPDLSSVLVSIDGCIAHIDVKERVLEPIKEDKSKPSNLIASDDGVITKLEITKGKIIVLKQSGVCKGQTLVIGDYADKKGNAICEHSSGKVFAKVEINDKITILKTSESKSIKETKESFGMQFLNKQIEIRPFKSTDMKKEQTRNQIQILGLRLPIYILNNKYTRYESVKYRLSQKEIEERKAMEIENYEKSVLFECNIISKSISEQETENEIVLHLNYCVEKNIAVQEYIEI